MADKKQNELDELTERIRDMLGNLGRLITGKSQSRPARVPVPVRSRPERYPRPNSNAYE